MDEEKRKEEGFVAYKEEMRSQMEMGSVGFWNGILQKLQISPYMKYLEKRQNLMSFELSDCEESRTKSTRNEEVFPMDPKSVKTEFSEKPE